MRPPLKIIAAGETSRKTTLHFGLPSGGNPRGLSTFLWAGCLVEFI